MGEMPRIRGGGGRNLADREEIPRFFVAGDGIFCQLFQFSAETEESVCRRFGFGGCVFALQRQKDPAHFQEGQTKLGENRQIRHGPGSDEVEGIPVFHPAGQLLGPAGQGGKVPDAGGVCRFVHVGGLFRRGVQGGDGETGKGGGNGQSGKTGAAAYVQKRGVATSGAVRETEGEGLGGVERIEDMLGNGRLRVGDGGEVEFFVGFKEGDEEGGKLFR